MTASFTLNADERIDTRFIKRKIEARIEQGEMASVDATGMALALCGDAIGANFFMVGVALQKGWLPVTEEALRRAVELNGVQVDFNLHVIRLGRLWAHAADVVEKQLAENAYSAAIVPTLCADALLADRAQRLTAYQNGAYAQRYLAAVSKVREAETRVMPQSTALSEIAARTL